nr:hypothetical protein [Streptomyces sp. DSM 41633]
VAVTGRVARLAMIGSPASGGQVLDQYALDLPDDLVAEMSELAETIIGTYRAVTANPATKAAIDAGRRKIAKQVSPDPQFLTMTPIDAETSVLAPKESTDGSATHRAKKSSW